VFGGTAGRGYIHGVLRSFAGRRAHGVHIMDPLAFAVILKRGKFIFLRG
jgi:hypothetical protein